MIELAPSILSAELSGRMPSHFRGTHVQYKLLDRIGESFLFV